MTRTEIAGFDLVSASVAPDGARTGYTYDTELNLVAVTGPSGLVWTYDYDPAGRLIREVDVDGRRLDYTYDDAGQVVAVTTAGSGTTTLRRDRLGRPVERRSGPDVTTFAYDASGRIVRATNADADVVLRRDVLGRVLSESIDGAAVTSSYDHLGRRVRRTTPAGAETRWEYGADNQPVVLRAGDHALTFDYDAAGRETARRLSADTVLTQTWDPVSRLTSQSLAGGSGLLQRRSFTYRADDAVTEVDELLAGLRRYDLDALGRVTAVRSPAGTEAVDYTPAGAPAYLAVRLER